jgi:hypothetical protein
MTDADPKEHTDPKHRHTDDDRRDSPRVPMTFLVRDVGKDDGDWEERAGDLSLGGIAWTGKTAALGRDVDCRFRLPGFSKELWARGEIIRVKDQGDGIIFNLRFTELELETELAIAKYLQEWLKTLEKPELG